VTLPVVAAAGDHVVVAIANDGSGTEPLEEVTITVTPAPPAGPDAGAPGLDATTTVVGDGPPSSATAPPAPSTPTPAPPAPAPTARRSPSPRTPAR
jgi:hypothetical protein